MPKKRKPTRVISTAYKDSIKPDHISSEHWSMWMEYNSGLRYIEIAMIHHLQEWEVSHILNSVIERLRYKVEHDDIMTVEQAQAFRERIKANVELARLSGMRVVNIMSEV
jgi:hypothetical protein